MRLSLLLILTVCLSFSCKTVKTASGKKIKLRSAEYLQKKLSNKVDVDWMTANAKLKLNNNGQTVRANADIRFKKDSFIWMRVTKFGFEGARALITKDSIFVLNRLNSTYVASDFSYIENRFHLPANFERLQDVLLGNAFMVTTDNMKSDVYEESYTLLADNPDGITNAYWMDAFDYALEKMVFQDLRRNRQVTVAQSDYKSIDTKQPFFAHHRNIAVASPETGNAIIDMTLSKVKINQPTTYKFSIPSHYQRVSQ